MKGKQLNLHQTFKISLLIIALIFLSSCGIVPEPIPNEIVYRALLVGVGDYMYISDLKSPSYNVDRMREIFGQCKFGEEETIFLVIDELKDRDATKENILNGIFSTFADADDNDVSYFYWMGHGGSGGFICPTDYTWKLESSITVEELEATLDTIQGTKVVIMETCHSGNFIEKDFNDKVIETFRQSNILGLNKDTYKVLTSCKGEQVCYECPDSHKPYGFFTLGFWYGCQELIADTDTDEIISLSEMYDYIKNWIDYHCKWVQDTQIYPEGSEFPIVEY